MYSKFSLFHFKLWKISCIFNFSMLVLESASLLLCKYYLVVSELYLNLTSLQCWSIKWMDHSVSSLVILTKILYNFMDCFLYYYWCFRICRNHEEFHTKCHKLKWQILRITICASMKSVKYSSFATKLYSISIQKPLVLIFLNRRVIFTILISLITVLLVGMC